MAEITDKTIYSNKSDIQNYILRSKISDPYAATQDNRLAKLVIPSDLKAQIEATYLKTMDFQSHEADDSLKKLIDNGGYIEFFLSSVDEVFSERFQVSETLGDTYSVFGMGEKPMIFGFTGALINSTTAQWRLRFIDIYRRYLRVSRLARFRTPNVVNTVYLYYDDVALRGAILNLRTSLRADNEIVSPFSFSMLVTDFQINAGGLRDQPLPLNHPMFSQREESPLSEEEIAEQIDRAIQDGGQEVSDSGIDGIMSRTT